MSLGTSGLQRYSAWLAALVQGQGRDESHGMAHFERVRAKAVELAGSIGEALSGGDALVLEFAALSHDVLDHKYCAADPPGLRSCMEAALQDLGGLTAEQVRAVCLVADNVSLSKELRGETELRALADLGCLELRNLVSDADKLDALGRQGLERLAQYQVHLLRLGGRDATGFTKRLLREVASAHLLHRAEHLKTEAARAEGARLLAETTQLMASDAALDDIIDAVLAARPVAASE